MNDLSALEPDRYPALAAEIEAAHRVLGPRLLRARELASRRRSARRWFWLGIGGGGALAIVLAFAAVRTGIGFFFLAEAAFMLMLAFLTLAGPRAGSGTHWWGAAVCVQRLLGEGFRCVGKLGVYASASRPEELLADRSDRLLRLAEGANADG